MRFTKMQGLGNDYIYVQEGKERILDPGALAKRLSDRHFGIGADGLILIRESAKADFCMDIYNADGSRAEMCGNGLRCAAKYVRDRDLVSGDEMTAETLSGIRKIWIQKNADGNGDQITVDMGYPILLADQIPIISEHTKVIGEPIRIRQMEYYMTGVSMGNPHAVIFLKDIRRLDLAAIGPEMEYHGKFPKRTNVEFVQVENPREICVRVWERGTGETLACGTGACAAVVAGVLNDLTERQVTVKLKGGQLTVLWERTSGNVYMTGPAVTVYEGEIVL